MKEREDQIKTLEAEILDSVKNKEMELKTKISYETEQSNKVKELMKKNDIQISDLKYNVKTKEIELKGRIEKEKELSILISNLRKDNADLKEANNILNAKFAHQHLAEIPVNIFHTCQLCEKVYLNETDLTKHKTVGHTLPCKECDMRFNSNIHLTVNAAVNHHNRQGDIQLHKESESSFQCKIYLKFLQSK